MVGGAIEAVLSLPHAACVASTERRGIRPRATRLCRPAFFSHSSNLRRGGGRMVRGSGRATCEWARQEWGWTFGRNTWRLPGGVLWGVVIVVEARLVGGCLRVTATRWNAARRTEAAGITVTICIGECQRHNGVNTSFDELVLTVALFYLFLRILTVGSDLNTRAFKGRGPIRSQGMGQIIAWCSMVIILEAVACLVARGNWDDWAGL